MIFTQTHRRPVLCSSVPADVTRLIPVPWQLLEEPYTAFGRTDMRPEGERFNIVFPSTFGSDRRKPVSAEFQQFCETVYWPLANALLFGDKGWAALKPHLTSFKINTLRISEDEFYYNLPIYHFHLDHKIGKYEPNDENQKRTMRMIFSIVPGATRSAAASDGRTVTAVDDPSFDSTIYLRRQPPNGFHHNDELHAYLGRRFPERGVSQGRERPLYEVADSDLYRAKPGEICIHHSHPGRPIHAETNPCPEGRGLYVLDWADCRNVVNSSSSGSSGEDATPKQRATKQKVLPCTRMPVAAILDLMRVLERHGSEAFQHRLCEVEEMARELMAVASKFPRGLKAVQAVLRHVVEAQSFVDSRGSDDSDE